MLTWLEVLGKLIEFVAQKLLGKKIDLALDERQRACRGFLDFYDILFDLQALLDDFIRLIDPATHEIRPRRYNYRFAELADRADTLSKEFFQKAAAFGVVIKLYDAALYRILGRIVSYKMGSGFGLSRALSPGEDWFHVIRENDPLKPLQQRKVKRIEFKKLVKENAFDLEGVYEEGKRLLEQEGQGHRTPWNDILAQALEPLLEMRTVTLEDLPARSELMADLFEHKTILGKAQELLGQFIRTNFNIDDVLSASRSKSSRRTISW